jgi:hypothetical protein
VLKSVTRERLVKALHAGDDLACAVVICKLFSRSLEEQSEVNAATGTL